jgi:restriction system protein
VSGVAVALGLLVLAFVAAVWWRSRTLRRMPEWNPTAIDHMSGEAFEQWMAAYFRRLGWSARLTKRSGDFGADLLLTDPGGQRWVAQLKRYSHKVGVDAVQQVIGARAFYRAHRALVITNREFTGPARELAARAGVELWDRATLTRRLQRVYRIGSPLPPDLRALLRRYASRCLADGAPFPHLLLVDFPAEARLALHEEVCRLMGYVAVQARGAEAVRGSLAPGRAILVPAAIGAAVLSAPPAPPCTVIGYTSGRREARFKPHYRLVVRWRVD